MKTSRKIISVLFWALMGSILFASIGLPTLVGAIALQFMNLIPMPSGVLGENAVFTKEQEEFSEMIQKKLDKFKAELDRGFLTQTQFDNKFKEIEKLIQDNSGLDKFNAVKTQVEEIKTGLQEMALNYEKMRKHGNNTNSFKQSYDEAIGKAAELIREKIKAGNKSGFVDIEIKAPATMTEAANLSGSYVIQPNVEVGFNNIVRESFVLRLLSNTASIISNLITWVEQTAFQGSAANTAEGAASSQVSWSYVAASAKVEDITDYIKVTEDLLDDLPGLQAEISGNLIHQLSLKEDSQLLAGTGVTPQINGLTKYAKTLSNAALQNKVDLANNWDVIGAAIAQIYANGKGRFIPNAVIVNPIDFYIMTSAKATTGEYVMPIYSMPDGYVIAGVKLLQSVTIPQGSYLVGDLSRFNIRDRQTITIQMGWENDDFSKRLVTVRGVKRLGSFVKANDTEAFVYHTFAAGKTFLETA